MCLRKLGKYLGARALNDGSHAHQSVRNANSLRCVRLWVRAGAGKDQRGMMGIGEEKKIAREKHFINDECTYGSFENIYACLQLFMVAIRTNLFATPSLRVGTTLVRISEV